MEAPQELHRRPTLSHFMSRVESSNLRDLLKVRQDDADAASRRRSGDATRTLATILACEKRDMGNPSSSSSSISSVTKTLLDIIRDEQEPQHRQLANGSGSIGVIPGTNRGGGGVVNWKALKDRLWLRRANEGLQGSAFGETSQQRDEEIRGSSTNSSSPAVSDGGPRPLISILELDIAPAIPPQSPAPDEGAMVTTGATGNTSGRTAVRPSITAATTSGTIADTASSSNPSQEEPRINNPPAASSTRPLPPAQPSSQQPQPPQDEPTRVSLMALLEQADRTGGAGGPSFAAAVVSLVEDGHGEEVKEQSTIRTTGVEESLCCVCMVRNKGAAFIPCGHTFCRVCTRELWVSRGTCPLCNGFIIEILDIF